MTKVLRQSVLTAAIVAIAAPAFAQIAQPTLRPGRPSRGLFGGGVGETDQSLVLTASFGPGYDRDKGGLVTGPTPTTPTALPAWTGRYASASTRLLYTLNRSRVNIGANVGVDAHYKPSQENDVLRTFGAGANIDYNITSHTTLSGTEAYSRQPHNIQFLYGSWFDPSTLPSPLRDLSGVTGKQNEESAMSAVSLTQRVSNKLALIGNYAYGTYNAAAGDPTRTTRTHNAALNVSYLIFRNARLRVGYGYTASRVGIGTPLNVYKGPSADGGLDFGKAISLTRRLTFRGSTGVTATQDHTAKPRYFLVGHASLAYEIGRSWTASLNYRRGVDFFQGLGQPVILDTASAGSGGVVGRRVQLNVSAGASWGLLGITAGSSRFTSFSTSSTMRTALTRTLGVAVMYAYRQYHFDNTSTLPPGLRPETQRHSIRATFDLWLPLILRARRIDASR